MTPGALERALAARDIPWDEPDALLAALEARADRAPGVADWTALLLGAELMATARVPLPSGLRHDTLVRFDALSATWLAHDADDQRYLVRAPRPGIGAVKRRLLERDARALEGLLPVEHREDAIVVRAVGAALDAGRAYVPAVLLGCLDDLRRWTVHGFAPPPPEPDEIRIVDGRAQLCCLTPGNPGHQAWLRTTALLLKGRGELTRLLDGLISLPPASITEAEHRVRRAMIDDLSERIVTLRTRSLERGATDRRQRLIDAVARLAAALPAPDGVGPVGFDLEARPTRIVSASQRLSFGAEEDEVVIHDPEAGFDAPAARRFLRACASAPLASGTHPVEETQPGLTEALNRWVASGLKLRTVKLLLERT